MRRPFRRGACLPSLARRGRVNSTRLASPVSGSCSASWRRLRLHPLLVRRVDEEALRDAAAAGGTLGHRVRLVVDPDDRAVPRDHPVVGAQRTFRGPVLGVRGQGRSAVVRVDQTRPQLRIGEKRLRRIADDRLDLGAHVGEPAAVRSRPDRRRRCRPPPARVRRGPDTGSRPPPARTARPRGHRGRGPSRRAIGRVRGRGASGGPRPGGSRRGPPRRPDRAPAY